MQIHIERTPKLARRTFIVDPSGAPVDEAVGVDLIAGTIELREPLTLGSVVHRSRVVDGTGYKVIIDDASHTLSRASTTLHDDALEAVMLALWRVLGGPHEEGEPAVDVSESSLRVAVSAALAPFTANKGAT